MWTPATEAGQVILEVLGALTVGVMAGWAARSLVTAAKHGLMSPAAIYCEYTFAGPYSPSDTRMDRRGNRACNKVWTGSCVSGFCAGHCQSQGCRCNQI